MAYTTIKKPSDYFNTVTWTGDGTSDRSITGVGFQPDWVWYKERSNVGDQTVFDVIRGATKRIFPNDTAAEDTAGSTLTSFDSDGFTVGANTDVNGNGETYVGWNWLASNTTASNTDGSITSTVSANTTSGFSIVSYTGNGTGGATVGHGLNSEVKCIIVKDRDTASDWRVYHVGVGNTGALDLNTSDVTQTNSAFWNNTTPSSSVFTLGTGTDVNNNTKNFIAYCFAEKKGFSKFGSYTGNGNADGTFIYTGFKPAFVIIKNSSAVGGWLLVDNKRDPKNVVDKKIFANLSNSEGTADVCDFVSNGFKIRTTDSSQNGSGNTIIYMAFAEEPLVGDNPATAR